MQRGQDEEIARGATGAQGAGDVRSEGAAEGASGAFDPVAYINTPRWQASRLGLERIRALLDRLGRPQDSLRFVHVAGTNGKGSVCAYLASVLQAAGYRTGLFTSPFILRFEERIRVDGADISREDLVRATLIVREQAEALERETGDHPTEFELMCAVALVHFRAVGCDIVVLEVGLGGRLDSTNVIDGPEVCVIARIGLDHTALLGDTLAAVAGEKCGIVKPGVPVASWPQAPEALEVVRAVCAAKGCELVVPDFEKLQVNPLKLHLTPQEGEHPASVGASSSGDPSDPGAPSDPGDSSGSAYALSELQSVSRETFVCAYSAAIAPAPNPAGTLASTPATIPARASAEASAASSAETSAGAYAAMPVAASSGAPVGASAEVPAGVPVGASTVTTAGVPAAAPVGAPVGAPAGVPAVTTASLPGPSLAGAASGSRNVSRETFVREFSYRGVAYRTALLGSYQPANAALAIEALGLLRERGWRISPEAVREGIAAARWPGRFEVVAAQPLTIIDGGHNPQGAHALADSLADLLGAVADTEKNDQEGHRRVIAVMGVLADKDYPAMVDAVVPLVDGFVCYAPDNPRALAAADLAATVEARSACRAEVASDAAEALRRAREGAGREGIVVAFGSLYAIADLKGGL